MAALLDGVVLNCAITGTLPLTLGSAVDTVIKVAVALNFTINSGNNLGTANGVPFRIWVVALNNAGTVVLAVQKCVVGAASPTQVGPLAEDALQTTSPNSNGGNAAATLYCSAGLLSNVPMRILGYMEWSSGLATAGTWSSGPTKIQLFGPGVKKPGDSVQRLYLLTSNRKVTTSNTVVDTFVTQNFTPQGAPNVVQVRLNSSISVQANGHQAFWYLFRATGSALLQNRVFIAGSAITDLETLVTQELWDAPSGTSQVTYKVAIRNDDNATTIAMPSSNGDTSTLVIEEIMA